MNHVIPVTGVGIAMGDRTTVTDGHLCNGTNITRNYFYKQSESLRKNNPQLYILFTRNLSQWCVYVSVLFFSCQFVVTSDGDYKIHLGNADPLVDWKLIEQIVRNIFFILFFIRGYMLFSTACREFTPTRACHVRSACAPRLQARWPAVVTSTAGPVSSTTSRMPKTSGTSVPSATRL